MRSPRQQDASDNGPMQKQRHDQGQDGHGLESPAPAWQLIGQEHWSGDLSHQTDKYHRDSCVSNLFCLYTNLKCQLNSGRTNEMSLLIPSSIGKRLGAGFALLLALLALLLGLAEAAHRRMERLQRDPDRSLIPRAAAAADMDRSLPLMR
jgi:hypothetical protein